MTTNKEKALIIVEKLHGWPVGGWLGRKGPYPIVIIDGSVTGVWIARDFHETAKPYSPAENIAQAIEAVKTWCRKCWADERYAEWELHGQAYEHDECQCSIRCSDVFGEHQAFIGYSETEAGAITDALVKAVSDES